MQNPRKSLAAKGVDFDRLRRLGLIAVPLVVSNKDPRREALRFKNSFHYFATVAGRR